MAFSFAGSGTDANASTTSTITFNIGASPGPFVVVAFGQQNSHANPTMTIGGVSLNLDVIDGFNNSGFFSGVATGLSGNQTVALTAAGSGFETRSYSLWFTSAAVALSHTASGDGVASVNIPVNIGDFMAAISFGITDFNSSTVPPDANHIITGGAYVSGEWDSLAAANPAFSVKPNANFNGSVATYASSRTADWLIRARRRGRR